MIIQTIIKNLGETDTGHFEVACYDGSPYSGGTVIEKLTLNLLRAKSDTTINIQWRDDPGGAHSIFILLDADNWIAESNEYNNQFSQKIHLLTIKTGSRGLVWSTDSCFAVSIPPLAINTNSTLDIVKKSIAEIKVNYPYPESLKLIALNEDSPSGYFIRLADGRAAINKPFFVYFHSGKLNFKGNPRIYTWNDQRQQWIYCASEMDTIQNYISAEVAANTHLFGIFTISDVTPPGIGITINDQQFVDGDYVSSKPTISMTIEDESGIDLTNYPLLLTLNDQPVDTSSWVSSSNQHSNELILLTYRPSLTSGEYRLKIEAYDIAGNRGEANLNFIVSGHFSLQAIANHPNPFANETIIAYTLTEEAEEVKIRIYTVSGRLIRTFDFMNEMGYVEHVWDGRDEHGDEVANGVYYLRFVAKRRDARIETVEKMAKLR